MRTNFHSDEEKIADVHAAGPEDVDVAVKAARDAFQGRWRRMPGASRGAILLKLASLMEDNKNVLATIDTWDNGE